MKTLDFVTRHPLRSQGEHEGRIYFTSLAKPKRITSFIIAVFQITTAIIRILISRWFLFWGCLAGLVFLIVLFLKLDIRWISILLALGAIIITSLSLLEFQSRRLFSGALNIHIFSYEHYEGEVRLPKKVYVGDSQNISIDLSRVYKLLSVAQEAFHVHDNEGGKSVALQISHAGDMEKFLEVEFQAAAVTIDGEKKQQHVLNT